MTMPQEFLRPNAVVFTPQSLTACLEARPGPDWFSSFNCPEDGNWGVISVPLDRVVYVLGSDESSDMPRIVVITRALDGMPSGGKLLALQRIHRVALQTVRKDVKFPPAWSPFHADNRITIFAYPAQYGNDRLIFALMTPPPASRNPRGKKQEDIQDVFVCELTTAHTPVNLQTYSPDQAAYLGAIRSFPDAASIARARHKRIRRTLPEGVFDLEAVSFGAVSRGLPYSSWLEHLSEAQRRFVHIPPMRSLKLRGPAGSGKTLALQLKALSVVYDAVDKGQASPRVVYVTHSWAAAEHAYLGLETMDERGSLRSIDVFPLLTLAETTLRQRPHGYNILGEDSHSGKLNQLRVIATVLNSYRASDWIAYRGSCTNAFRARVEALPASAEHDTFAWDLMLEFSCVLSANGILPGVNALQRYLKIERMPWMMPLATDNEKRVVLQLYNGYVKWLEANRYLSSDQIIGDYLNFLATFVWHAQRRDLGYDFVFVDELHLFNEQERLVFHQLTRDPDSHPIIFMALDPRQSPAETYVEFNIVDSAVGESGRAAPTFGETLPIDLNEVHRYTPEILALLKHVDASYPALLLGEDWGVSLAGVESRVESGPVPELFRHPHGGHEIERVVAQALRARERRERTAILCLDHGSFERYKEYVSSRCPNECQTIESRDDIEQMRYTRRRVVLSLPEFVAGLQFDTVIMTGFEARFSRHGPFEGYELRRFLSGLYLGASRASKTLQIHFTDVGKGMPGVIEMAVQRGYLQTSDG